MSGTNRRTMAKSKENRIPDEFFIPLVDSFFKEVRSLLIGALIAVTAMVACFIKTDVWAFFGLALTFLLISAARLSSIVVYNRREEPLSSRSEATRWEMLYASGASIAVALLGIWCWLALALTDDPFVRLVSFSITIGYLIGVFGRNFGNSQFVTIQTLCASIPIIGALLSFGDLYHWLFAALLVPLFLSISFIAKRLRSILLEAISARLNAETALAIAKTEAEKAEVARQRATSLLLRLRQSKRSEEAAIATRDAHLRFLATMSHEIRTPLNGIVGALDLIDTAKAEKVPALIKTATSSADALLDIVSEVLDLAKLEYGETATQRKPFSPKQLVEAVHLALEPIALSKGLDLTATIDPEVPALVIGDPSRLRQVLINLTGNALKFTDSGSVTLAAQVRSHDDDQTGIDFMVIDSGMGIPEQEIKDIYEPFYSKTQSHCGDNRSTGLGLAIVKKAVEHIGGSIQCVSELGVGTTFTLQASFPVSAAADIPVEEKKTVKVRPHLTSARILLVEDNEVNALIVEDMLAETPYKVQRAKGGLEAVQMATEHDYDLILMDISMPDIDGVEACRRIRAARSEDSKTKIVALTANAVVGDRERFLTSGFDDYISKPIRKNALLNAIKDILAESERSTPSEASHSIDELPSIDQNEFAVFLAERKTSRAIQLLQIFAVELAKHRETLQDVHGDEQRNVTERSLHTIVGMSAAVGAKRLSEMARQHETNCRADAMPTATQMDELLDEISKVISEGEEAIVALEQQAA